MGSSKSKTPISLTNKLTKDGKSLLNIFTFGDSILDCGRYNKYNVSPGSLLVENRNDLFLEFKAQDLKSIFRRPVKLTEFAIDGSTVNNLAKQAKLYKQEDCSDSIALLTIGGNDLLMDLACGKGDFDAFKLN